MPTTGSTAAADNAESAVFADALKCSRQELADLLPTVERDALRCLRLMQGINGLELHLSQETTSYRPMQNTLRLVARRLIDEARRKRRNELPPASAAVDPHVDSTGNPSTREKDALHVPSGTPETP